MSNTTEMDKLIEEYQGRAKLVEDCRAEIIALEKRIAESPLGKAVALRRELLAEYLDDAREAENKVNAAVLGRFNANGNLRPHPPLDSDILKTGYGLGIGGRSHCVC